MTAFSSDKPQLDKGIPSTMLVSLAIIVLASVGAGIIASQSHLTDFRAEWIVAQETWKGDPHAPFGEIAERHGHDEFAWVTYPNPRTPGALLLQLPLTLVPESGLSAVAGVFIFASVLLLGVATWRLAGPLIGSAVALAAAFLPPGIQAVKHGQTSIITVALLGLFWLGVREGDRSLAGIPLGVAITFKLFPWIILVGLFGRRRRAAIGAASTLVALALLGLAVPAITLNGTIDALTTAQQFVGSGGNVSLLSALSLPVSVGLTIGLIGALVAWTLRIDVAMVLLLALSLLVAPIVWSHYLLVVFIAVSGWIGSDRRTSPTAGPTTAAISREFSKH